MIEAYHHNSDFNEKNVLTLSIRSVSTPNFPPYPYDALGMFSFCFTFSCSSVTLFLSSATLQGPKHMNSETDGVHAIANSITDTHTLIMVILNC